MTLNKTTTKVLDLLVDIGEAAAGFGVSEQTIKTWAYRSGRGQMDPPFPEPVRRFRGGREGIPVFYAPDLEAWAKASKHTARAFDLAAARGERVPVSS